MGLALWERARSLDHAASHSPCRVNQIPEFDVNHAHRSKRNRTPSVTAILAALALVCTIAACSRLFTGPADPPQDVVLGVGEAALVGRSTVRVVALEDSRCPAGVDCFWAGDVVIVLAFSGAGEPRTDTLRFLTTPKTVTYDGLLFQPLAIQPYPTTTPATAAKTVTLHVTP